MAVSYVLVTAAAVLVVEVVVLALVLPGLLSPAPADAALLVQVTAREQATLAVKGAGIEVRLPPPGQLELGEPDLQLPPGQAMPSADGTSVRIPHVSTAESADAPMSMALLLDPDGKIVATSYPARYPAGMQFVRAGVAPFETDILRKLGLIEKGSDGRGDTASGRVIWALSPVRQVLENTPKSQAGNLLGFMYVQIPASARLADVDPGIGAWDAVGPVLGIGVLVLLAALPVGLVFGLFSTKGLIGRLRRLATSTVAVADGDYLHRVPVTGADEIAQLESNFNRMAARLNDAMAAERQLASATERARIARELHDSISQDLFSLRLLAGGLRRALPAGSPLQPQIEAMELTASGTMHEMQALLLELRPIALNDASLVQALTELCEAYRDRLGVKVNVYLDPVELDPAVEHAVLRIVQEALANAVKHARPSRITLQMRRDDLQVEISVTDDGAGFDPLRAAERHGMGLSLMRERIAEHGGGLEVRSAPGAGTTVTILLPRSWP
jgi:signal transduction histidine kinase